MEWKNEDLELLKGYLALGDSRVTIATKMNRSFDSICHAMRKYGLKSAAVSSTRAIKAVESIDLESLDDTNFKEMIRQAVLKWNPAKTKIPKNKKRPYKMMLVTSDQHIPHHEEGPLRAIFGLMEDVPFDINVLLGDYLDYGCISHWNTGHNRTLEMQRLKSDYIIGNVLLDEYDKRLPAGAEKHFFKGNHEVWIDDLIEKTPQLEGLVEPETNLKLAERGYKIYRYNDVVPFGKLNLTHGMYAGANPTKKHLDECKVNIMFGHTHTMEMRMSSSPARDIAFSGYNVGCLCHMMPDYMKNRASGWTHGFAVVYLYDNGYFEVNMIRILDNKFIFNGKVYQG